MAKKKRKRIESRQQAYAKKRKLAAKKAKITREINKFTKAHKDQILEAGHSEYPGTSDEKLITMFKASVRARQAEVSKRELSVQEIKKNLKKELHSESWFGKDKLDFESTYSQIREDVDARYDFRKLRGWNQKFDLNLMKREEVPAGADSIRRRYSYDSINGVIILDLIYDKENGSSYWLVHMEGE